MSALSLNMETTDNVSATIKETTAGIEHELTHSLMMLTV